MLLSSIYAQFVAIFAGVLLLNYLCCCVGDIVSLVGSAIIISALSWKIAKCVHSHYSRKNPISSFQKAVLITGCDSGFGNLLALKLNEHGFVVYATVLDTESDGSMDLKKNCVFPKSMNVIKMDVTNDEEVAKTYNYVSEHLKKESIELWGLVNNAGLFMVSHIDWGSLNSYRKVFEVNVFGVVRVTRTFLPLIRQSKGRVVIVASNLSRFTPPFVSYYSMSKHAVLSFSDALRREMNKWEVNVSAILPGPFRTNFVNTGVVAQQIDNVWQSTDESVKQTYSQQYYEDKKASVIAEMSAISNTDFDLVVDAMVDALTNPSPQIQYKVHEDWMSYIFTSLLVDLLPVEWLDQVVDIKSKYVD